MSPIVPRKCAHCEQWRGANNVIPVVVDDTCTLYVCAQCIADHDGTGKFEGLHDDDLAFALAVWPNVEDYADHWLTDCDGSSAYLVGTRVVVEDERGFVDVRSFATKEQAQREIDGYEDAGMGAQDDDAWIGYESNGIHVSFAGKSIGRFETLRRAKAAVSVAMRKEGYFPNVWLTGEHGPSIRRIDVW